MTQEEKAKAYDNVIKKLSDFYREYDTISGLIDVKEELANLFPELVALDNERIRKEMIKGISKTLPNTIFLDTNVTREDAIAYLEKQHKPAWTEKDEEYFNDIVQTLRKFVINGGSEAKRYTEEEINWLKSKCK